LGNHTARVQQSEPPQLPPEEADTVEAGNIRTRGVGAAVGPRQRLEIDVSVAHHLHLHAAADVGRVDCKVGRLVMPRLTPDRGANNVCVRLNCNLSFVKSITSFCDGAAGALFRAVTRASPNRPGAAGNIPCPTLVTSSSSRHARRIMQRFGNSTDGGFD
jgi:hypothetical protein